MNNTPFIRTRGEYTVSDNKSRLDLNVIHSFLTRTYWAEGIKMDRIERVVEHSFCFGLFKGEQMIGFGRVLSDTSAIAYMMDFFVLEEHRGKGLGKWLVESVLAYPPLQDVRRWMLATEDAHSLYSRYGFGPYEPAEELMMKYDPEKYKQ